MARKPDSERTQKNVDERRRYYRVAALLPILLRSVHEAEAEALRFEIGTRGEDAPEIEDAGMKAAILRLERKLDQILELVGTKRARPLRDEDTTEILLSASGVALQSDESFEEGQQVLVELRLPGTPPRDVRALSHVVRDGSDPIDGKGANIALCFDAVSDADRAAIVRFSYEVQRKQLRERSSRDGE